MEILQNSLIEWRSPDPGAPRTIERILKIDPARDHAVVIEMTLESGMPERRSHTEILNAVESGEARILETDPWFAPAGDDLPEALKEARDKSWAIIQPIISLPNPFSKKRRKAALHDALKQTARARLYSLLRRYWRGGQNINALVPRYANCGAPGVPRLGKGKKSGRKARHEAHAGKQLTEKDRSLIERGFERFYCKETRPSARRAYERTCEEFYNDGYRNENGIQIPELSPPNKRPSFRQFKYLLRDKLKSPGTHKKRMGERKFNLNKRELNGRFRSNGPGSRFMIDATKGDIYLVSEYDKNQSIGRATIYLVIDHFSHLIAGFYLGIGEPSAKNAGLALANAGRDKQEFCAEYGKIIKPEEWPCRHLPNSLLADQGELRGPIAEPWIDNLGIRIDQTPTNRADLKGAVERAFDSLQKRVFYELPGYVVKTRARRDKNPAQEARFTLSELTCLVIDWIIEYNSTPLTGILQDDLPKEAGLTPTKLWAWGIENRGAELKTVPQEILLAATLPKGKATVNRQGISFRQTIYSCETAIREEWGASKVGERFPCHYDPNNTSVLYICHQNKELEQCEIKHANDIAWGKSWFDMEKTRADQNLEMKSERENVLQLRAARHAKTSAILKTKTKGRRLSKNIREARAEEIALQGGTQAIPESALEKPTNVIPMPPPEEPDLNIDRLQMLKKMKG